MIRSGFDMSDEDAKSLSTQSSVVYGKDVRLIDTCHKKI